MEDDGTLSIGTRLGEFEIRGLVGIGGFGIVYRAFDHDLEREVAIKEYMPGLLASRTVDGQVQARGRTHAETFEAGRRSFMLEAKMLARFDHPALVKVFRFWEGNGTAYMVMPLYTGQTLAHALKQLSTPPTEAWLMGVLVPLLGALEALHSQQIFHRDVSPDNILLLRNGRPVLLDFGAARQVISDRTQTLTAILKPNYAPIEQYAEVPNLRQGPWTDLYALGAVVYASLTGKPPPPAAARTMQDDLVPLTEVAARLEADHGQHYSAKFLDAWQQTLAVRPNERPQSVQALMELLGLLPSSLDPDSDATVIRPMGDWSEVKRDSDQTVIVPTGLSSQPRPARPEAAVATHQTGRDMRIIPPSGATAATAVTGTPPRTNPTVRNTASPPTTSSPPSPPPSVPTPTLPPSTPTSRPAAPTPEVLTALEKPPARSSHGVTAIVLAGLLSAGVLGYLLTRPSTSPLPTEATSAGPAAVAASTPASATAASPASASASSEARRTPPPIIDEEPERAPARTPEAVASSPAALAATAASKPGPAASAPDKAALAAAKASAAAAKASAAAAKAAAQASAAAARQPQSPALPSSTTNANAETSASRPTTQASRPLPAPAPAPARTVDDLCGKRVFIARDMCIQDACQTPEFSRSATCTELKRKAEEERIRKLHTDG